MEYEKIVFERDGLKSEGFILRKHTHDITYLVESPGGITWVHAREIINPPWCALAYVADVSTTTRRRVGYCLKPPNHLDHPEFFTARIRAGFGSWVA